jgi:2-polyprenyl-3-methyl-5-hydroxy-6-metoxy-1,4-benzoquinol methylase
MEKIMSSDLISNTLIQEVQGVYKTGFHFTRAYLEYWFKATQQSFLNLSEILAMPQPKPMWFEYALSANQRGTDFLNQHSHLFPTGARRYLDIGCGLGGFVTSFAQQGFEVRGIEIDSERSQLARQNCRDFNLKDCIFDINILDWAAVSQLGCFDVITCFDVLEHVLDVPLTLENIFRLLVPGGVALLHIPNKDCIDFVRADGHFSLFGITLLKRSDAIIYHQKFFNFDYDVGDYYPLQYYLGLLSSFGKSIQFAEKTGSRPSTWSRDIKQKVKATDDALSLFLIEKAQELPPAIVDIVNHKYRTYRRKLLLEAVLLAPFTLGWSSFSRKYLESFWTVVFQKGS